MVAVSRKLTQATRFRKTIVNHYLGGKEEEWLLRSLWFLNLNNESGDETPLS